jgi:hypothetical protein
MLSPANERPSTVATPSLPASRAAALLDFDALDGPSPLAALQQLSKLLDEAPSGLPAADLGRILAKTVRRDALPVSTRFGAATALVRLWTLPDVHVLARCVRTSLWGGDVAVAG